MIILANTFSMQHVWSSIMGSFYFSMKIRFPIILFFSLLLSSCETTGVRTVPVDVADTTNIPEMAAMIDSSRIRSSIESLVSFGTRMTGYPGATAAANYLAGEFRRIGLEDVDLEEFVASVPLDEGGELVILDNVPDANPMPLFSVWPNLIRTSTLPPGGLTARMYYVGEGDWEDFNGIEVADAIIMMDFNTGLNWQNAANLGARAVVLFPPPRRPPLPPRRPPSGHRG